MPQVAGLLLPLQALVWAGPVHLDAHAEVLLDLLIDRRDSVMELMFDTGPAGVAALEQLCTSTHATADLERVFCDEGKLANAPRSKKELRRMLTSNLPESTKLWHRSSMRGGRSSYREANDGSGRQHIAGVHGDIPTPRGNEPSMRRLHSVRSLRDMKRRDTFNRMGVAQTDTAASDPALKVQYSAVYAVAPPRRPIMC